MHEWETKPDKYLQLQKEFYFKDSLTVAPALIGCVIETRKHGISVSGRIVETEAYPSYDVASHAFKSKRTPRTEIQFKKGGCLYVYQIMGLHLMTSVVVGEEGVADVVFIRSIEPLTGIEMMMKRRGCLGDDIRKVASGPGMLSVALGIDKSDNGADLCDGEPSVKIYKDIGYIGKVNSGKRINLGVHGGDDVESKQAREQTWRFFAETSKFLSR